MRGIARDREEERRIEREIRAGWGGPHTLTSLFSSEEAHQQRALVVPVGVGIEGKER